MKTFSGVLILLLVSLSGCAKKYSYRAYETMDLSEKSIAVPAGSEGFLAGVKDQLKKEGWMVKVYRGEELGEKASGLPKYEKFETRYRLLMASKITDYCAFSTEDWATFNLSVVDNKTGEEMFTLSGQGCSDSFQEDFRKAISGAARSK